MDARTRRFVRVSGSAESVLGYAVERWRDAPGFWIGVLHPEDRERVATAVWRAVREGAACEIEYRVVASDGTVVRLRDRVRRVEDAAGVRLQGSTIDVGERIRPVAEPDSPRARRWRRSRGGSVLIPQSVTGQPAASVPPSPPPTVPSGHGARVAGPGPPSAAVGSEPAVAVEPATAATAARPPSLPPLEQPAALPVGPGAVPTPPPAPPPSIPEDTLVARMGEAVVATDASHRIAVWNPAAEQLFGWSAADAIGRPDHEVFAVKADAGQTAEIVAGLVGRRPWSALLTIRRRDGLPVPVRLTASALWSRDGSVAGYVAVVTDLGDVAARAESREAAAAMDAVARLARAVAHELSDGMSKIDSAVRTALSRLPTSNPARVWLDHALRSVDATSAMAVQLRAIGRDRPVVPALIDLCGVIERSLPALHLLAGPDIDVVTELDPGVPPVRIDPAVASQVVLHLAANGCAAMHERGRLVIAVREHEIGPRVARGTDFTPGAYVVMEVRDTRDRLPESLDRVFEPLAQPGGAHAMGLAAAHGLVTLSGGRLAAEPASGGGLVFRAYFRAES